MPTADPDPRLLEAARRACEEATGRGCIVPPSGVARAIDAALGWSEYEAIVRELAACHRIEEQCHEPEHPVNTLIERARAAVARDGGGDAE